jgi:hypothetical protein
MRFEGKNYDEKTKTWYDSGGAGRHIPPSSITGTPTIAIQGSNKNGSSKRSFQVLKGTTAEFINFGKYIIFISYCQTFTILFTRPITIIKPF